MSNQVRLGTILDELVREDKRKAYQIADAAGVTTQSLSSYRTNERAPWSKLEHILGVLGYEIDIVLKEK